MTPVEFIFLGLLCGAFVLVILAAGGFAIWLLWKTKASIDALTRTVQISTEHLGASQALGAVKIIATEIPGLVVGVSGLAKVMGVFNGVLLDRKKVAPDLAVGTQRIEEESTFTAYDEEAMAEQERIQRVKRELHVDIPAVERRMDAEFANDKGFFPGSGATPPTMADVIPNSSPPKFVPPHRVDEAAIRGPIEPLPAVIEVDGQAVQGLSPTPTDMK